jgi:ribosomal protein S18 acetylase RimI-like enzyme
MEISPAVSEDCPAIARAQVCSWQAAYAGILPDEYLAGLSVEKRETMWRELILRGSLGLLVARDGPRIVGFVAFGRCRDGDAVLSQAEIWAIYVIPAYWSRGVGFRLWEKARERLRGQGYQTISLWVLTGNARAIRFYARAGFRPQDSSVKDFIIGGRVLQEIRYVVDLQLQLPDGAPALGAPSA